MLKLLKLYHHHFCLFIQPIAAHDFTIFTVWYKYFMQLLQKVLLKSIAVYDALLRE